MRLILVSFFLVYTLLHVYGFFRARAALTLSFRTNIFIAIFMLIMVLAPFIINFSERHGFEFFARVMSYIGYIWMGVLFLFVSSSLLFEIYRLVIFLTALISRKNFSTMIPSAGFSFFIPLVLSMTVSAYGFFEAMNIRTEQVTIRTSKLPDNISRLKIVQISDVHIGLIVREDRLKGIIDSVNAASPDILVSTGDLVDGQINKLEGLAELLKEINPRYGKFAITGNHEFYAGIDQALDFTRKAGFKLLQGESVHVGNIMNIAGVDDPAGNTFNRFNKVSEKALLSELNNGRFTLLLKHRPFVDNASQGLFDLQLSGHTHKGQIFPFSLITKMFFPHQSGIFNIFSNSTLYVSRGTGTWGPPMRFMSPPEVTVIELVRESRIQ
ncbi:MAG: metallophosphoesterase [Nitrospirae bacterium]|nr:metallophosphoesterase [Nitrospirota bacterium]